jgi:hypothetical protein
MGQRDFAGVNARSEPAIPNVLKAVGNGARLAAERRAWRLSTRFAVVRLVCAVELGSEGIPNAALLAADWESRAPVCSSRNCGHCHGTGGADASYAGMKTLARISKRKTDERILGGGQQFGAVDMTNWSKSAKEVLLLCIRGL